MKENGYRTNRQRPEYSLTDKSLIHLEQTMALDSLENLPQQVFEEGIETREIKAFHIYQAQNEIQRTEMREALQIMLSKIDKRERQVIEWRYFDGRTRIKVAREQMITPERLRQLEERALARLRPLAYRENLLYQSSSEKI